MTTRGKQIRHEHAQTHTDYLKSASPLAFVIRRNCLACSFCVSQIFWTDQRWLTIKQEGLSHYVTPLKNGDATTWQHSHTALVCSETHLHWYTQTHTHITVALKQVNTFCCRFCSQLQSNWNSDCLGAFQSHRYRNTTTPICTHW